MNYRYFISYKNKTDKEFASQLGANFAQRNIKYFLDANNLTFGKSWLDGLKQGIKKSEFMIALFTPDYIEQVELQGEDNIILQELELAVSQDKLLPVVIGVSIEEMLTRCTPAIPGLKDSHCFEVDAKNENNAKFIVYSLTERYELTNDVVQPKEPVGFAESLLIPMPKQSLMPEEAYHKFDRLWSKDEALQYKEELEKKSERTALENTVLAKFYLSGRFDIRIDPEMAMNLLLRTNPDQCKYTLFEIGKVFYYGDTVFGYSDKKAIDSFKKADNLGYYPATILLASLFKEQCNKTKIDELKKIIGETEHSYSIPAMIQHDYDSLYERGIDLAKGDEGRDPVSAKYWQANALFSQNKDHAMAKILLQQSAESSIGAKGELAWYLLYSEHFQRNIDEAARLLQASEDAGGCYARHNLARLHLEPLKENESFIQVPQLAVAKFKQNIALGYHDSTDALASCSHKNSVLKASRDNNEIESSLLKAIEAGHDDSRAELGYYYCYVWEKKNEALNIWSKAASIKGGRVCSSGYVNRQLAELYLRDDPSEALDINKAEYHAIAAFLEGVDMSEELLEIAFLKDNIPLAHCWFKNGMLKASDLLSLYFKWLNQRPFQAYAFLGAASQGGHVDAMYVHLMILTGSKFSEDDAFNTIVSSMNPNIKLGDVIVEKYKQITDLSDENNRSREGTISKFKIMRKVFEAKQLTYQPLANGGREEAGRAAIELQLINSIIGSEDYNFKDKFSTLSVINDLFSYLKPTFENFSYYAPLYYNYSEMSIEDKVERLTKLHGFLDKENYKNKTFWAEVAPCFVIMLCRNEFKVYQKESWYFPILNAFTGSMDETQKCPIYCQAALLAKATLFCRGSEDVVAEHYGLNNELSFDIGKVIEAFNYPAEDWLLIKAMDRKAVVKSLEERLLDLPSVKF